MYLVVLQLATQPTCVGFRRRVWAFCMVHQLREVRLWETNGRVSDNLLIVHLLMQALLCCMGTTLYCMIWTDRCDLWHQIYLRVNIRTTGVNSTASLKSERRKQQSDVRQTVEWFRQLDGLFSYQKWVSHHTFRVCHAVWWMDVRGLAILMRCCKVSFGVWITLLRFRSCRLTLMCCLDCLTTWRQRRHSVNDMLPGVGVKTMELHGLWSTLLIK